MRNSRATSGGLIGKQVQLRPSHPHKGQTGRIVATKQIDGETAVRIRLDAAYGGECFAFPGHWFELT